MEFFDLTINGKKIIYLDNGATTPKPKIVLETYLNYLQNETANTHSTHQLSINTAHKVSKARQVVADFVNSKPENIIFTSGATATFNLLANSFWISSLGKDKTVFDISSKKEILVTVSDHHSNFVPWQVLAKKLDMQFVVANSVQNVSEILAKINHNTAIVAMPHISNVTGNCFDIYTIQKKCKEFGAMLVVDACQSVAHQQLFAKDLDFVVFSSHKMYAPSGVGVLVSNFLTQMQPTVFGGDMVQIVTKEKTTWADLPHKLEAGTSNFGAIIALGEAIKFIQSIPNIDQKETNLTNYLRTELGKIEDIKFVGNGKSIVSFVFEGVHSLDIAMYLDTKNIAIRSGSHCAQPLLEFLKLEDVCRISVGFYNTFEELDYTITQISKFVAKIRNKKNSN